MELKGCIHYYDGQVLDVELDADDIRLVRIERIDKANGALQMSTKYCAVAALAQITAGLEIEGRIKRNVECQECGNGMILSMSRMVI